MQGQAPDAASLAGIALAMKQYQEQSQQQPGLAPQAQPAPPAGGEGGAAAAPVSGGTNLGAAHGLQADGPLTALMLEQPLVVRSPPLLFTIICLCQDGCFSPALTMACQHALSLARTLRGCVLPCRGVKTGTVRCWAVLLSLCEAGFSLDTRNISYLSLYL